MRVLALSGILPAGATLYFFVFWRWFDFWRKHRVATYTMMFGTFGVLGAAVYLWRGVVFAHRVGWPPWVEVTGWTVIAFMTVVACVADRQIGFRVRSFTPFFEQGGPIELKTTGAYGLVRHPIYATGIGYQLGVFLVTGYLAVAAASAVFTLGALWFTRQEERRLMERLPDPGEYERYRKRVGGLFPWRFFSLR
jgi:protein-S-isoprenylcysteine O-methyltransferase Ste14